MQFNQAVVAANQSKAYSIVAGPITGSTRLAQEFATHAEKIGADAIMLYYPERYYNDSSILDYFQDVASQVSIDILIHGVPLRTAFSGSSPTTNYSLNLCQDLAHIPNLIGMKEEFNDETHRYKLGVHLKGKMSLIVAGASMRKYLSCTLFGISSYLVGIGSFMPQIEEDFFKLTQTNDYDQALSLVTKYEEPFFDTASPIGWHLAMKAALNAMDLMPLTERPPLTPATVEDQHKIRRTMKKFNWI